MNVILAEFYLTNITYLQVTGMPSCCREIIAYSSK